MTQEKTLLNELRMLNIALKRGMQTVVGGDAFHVPAVSSMALHYIFLQGGSALQKDVESEFHLRRSTASELLGRLEQEGYVTRQAEAGDSRAKRVFLSEKAEREQGEIACKFREVERRLDSALTDEERQTFFVLCEKIRKRIENPENPRGGV